MSEITPGEVPSAFAGILDGIEEPAVLLSTRYEILAANQAYQALYGDLPALEGRHCYEMSHHYPVPCDQAGEVCPLKNCLLSEQPQRVLHLHHTPRGEEHVDVSLLPIRDEQGRIQYLLEKMRPAAGASTRPSARGLVGRSRPFNQVLELIQRVAPSEATVLLLGESGTGKELVANAIHEGSQRARFPFVPVDCTGLSETLFESELFGHEKGAFTGAHSRKIGLAEAARGGTLFLDEIGDIPLSQQVKLLRLLETGTFRRVGGIEAQKADFRLIAATNRNLESMVHEGRFREDLYYRLSVFPIHLPPLRERRDDLPLLIQTLLQRIAPGRSLRMSREAETCIRSHDFPGNVRELRNVLERAVLLCDGDVIEPRHLPEECARVPGIETGDDEVLPLEEVERRYLRRVSLRFTGDRRELARRLGISERTLYRKLQQAG